MRSAAIGIGTIFIIFFMFISMSTIAESAQLYEETHTALNEAIYQTGVFLEEDSSEIKSEEDLKKVLVAFIEPLLSHPENYELKIYTLDHENGLLDVGLQTSFMPWNNKYNTSSTDYGIPKVIEARRTVIIETLAEPLELDNLKPLGGRIFYIDPSDNGATYTFYDEDDNELTTQTVEGLATAVKYKVSGTPTNDKFYVYATTDGKPDSHILLKSKVQWGAYNKTVSVTTDGIGQGKPNTEVALANSECFKDSTSGTQETGSNTVWTWLKDKIDNNQNGCNDWFIPSVAELKKLQSSGLEKTYIINTMGYNFQYLWSSVEYNKTKAYYVNWSSGGSDYYAKYVGTYLTLVVWGCVAVRSF